MNLGNINNINDDNDEDEDDEDIKMDGEVTKKLTPSEWKLRKQCRMRDVKLEIADIGESILQDPYKHCTLLPVIFQLCDDADVEICQLAMLSLTRIIIDIMPPYKIGTIDQNVSVKF